MNLHIETELEEDGRWIAEIAALPASWRMAKRATAMAKVEVLALRVLAEKLENAETKAVAITISLASARICGHRQRRAAFSLHWSALGCPLKDTSDRTKRLRGRHFQILRLPFVKARKLALVCSLGSQKRRV